MRARPARPAPCPRRPGRQARPETPKAGPAPSGAANWDPNVPRAPKPKPMQVLRGIAVSPGVAIGPALVVDPRGLRLPPRSLAPGSVAGELARLDLGLGAARDEAMAAEADARGRLGPQYADILAAHAQMIADPTLRRDARARIE